MARLKLTGARELDRVLARLPARVAEQALLSSARAGANVVRKEAKAQAPKGVEPAHPKYGRLADSIRATRDKSKETRNRVLITVHPGRAFWGLFQEFGTRNQAARPWLRTAFDAAAAPALKRMGEALGRAIEREAVKLAGSYAKAKKGLGVKR